MRRLVYWTLLSVLAFGNGILPGQAQSLISQPACARYGLTRAWYAQIGSQRANGELVYVNYDDGMLLAQSSRGMLTAIDAETGRTLWATQVGVRDGSTSEPAANGQYVVVVNGSTLYVVSRANGDIAWHCRLSGAPGAGPGVSQTHAFVPIITGLIEGYDLAKGAKQTPWNYQSSGRVLTPPMTTDMTVSWTTEKGYFYVADPQALGIRYRLETGDEIHSRPASWSPRLFAGSADGYVYAVNEDGGKIAWKFPVGEAIYEQPVAIESRVFVVTEFGGMFCFDAINGDLFWHTANVSQFVAASPSRVYVCDRAGSLSILDINGGSRIGTMPLTGITRKVINGRSDRIFLVNNSCVIQCLHETQLDSPVVYKPPAPKQKDLKLAPSKPANKAEEAPAETADETPKPPADDEFFEGDAPKKPSDEAENPFGP